MLAYNHAGFIREAADSVLAQTEPFGFELIIGEDGSTDATRIIAEDIARTHPDRVRLVVSGGNVGLGENFRRLIRAARAPYLAFCEADDFWTAAHKLGAQAAMLDANQEASFVYADFNRLSQIAGRRYVFRDSTRNSGLAFRSGAMFEDLLDQIGIHLSTVMCRAELAHAYIESALYDPDLHLADVPLFLYLAHHGQVLAMEETVSTYRHHAGSITQKSAASRLRVVQDHVKSVHRFEDAFGSAPARRAARKPRLDAMIADAAYAARNAEVFRAHSGAGGWRAHARFALMHVPPLHAAWIGHMRRKQAANFLAAATPEPASGPA